MCKHPYVSRRMVIRRLGSAILALGSFIAVSSTLAAGFPTRPITLVVGYPPGGSNDIVARIVAPPLGKALNTTVIVENRAGASGIIGANHVVNAHPDGYTLLLSSASPVVLAPQTTKHPPFNAKTDLMAINTVGLTPEAIAAGPNLTVKSLEELLALARTRQITLASSGVGGLPHLTIELLKQATKDNKIMHVPYRGAGPAVTDTLAGHVDGIVMDLPPLYSLIKDGRLKALAVTSGKRVSFLPDIPTAQEQLPNFNVVNWVGIFAPAKTPSAVVDRINAALHKVVANPDVRAQLEKVAVIPSVLDTSEDFQKFFDQEYNRWGTVIKEAGVSLTD